MAEQPRFRRKMSPSGLILIVEDREDDRFILERMLRRLGVSNRIIQLPTGDAALKYLGGHDEFADRTAYPLPSVLFLDLKMPGTSGFDVLRWLQTNPLPEKTLVLVVSELHSALDINRAYRLGATSFFCKPLNEVEMRECLRSRPEPWQFDVLPSSRAA